MVQGKCFAHRFDHLGRSHIHVYVAATRLKDLAAPAYLAVEIRGNEW
jgi:hypothetical protein